METRDIQEAKSLRNQARIEFGFRIEKSNPRKRRWVYTLDEPPPPPMPRYTRYDLKVEITNVGESAAEHIEAVIELPCILLYESDAKEIRASSTEGYCLCDVDNKTSDRRRMANSHSFDYERLLRGRTRQLQSFRVAEDFEAISWNRHVISWTTYADDAPPISGEILVSDVKFVDLCEHEES